MPVPRCSAAGTRCVLFLACRLVAVPARLGGASRVPSGLVRLSALATSGSVLIHIRQKEEAAIAAVDYFVQLVEQHGLVIIFVNVLVEQLGAPLPTYPILVMAGALLETSTHSASVLLALAVGAALIADCLWYAAGRRYGNQLMALLCRIALSPNACVSRTESLYRRWGAPSLLIAKFIPGFASIASVLAGALGTGRRRFLLFDGLGATLWAGSAIYLGSLFSTAVDDFLLVLGQMGFWGLVLLGLVVAIFVARRWWQRARGRHTARVPAISAQECGRPNLTVQLFEE